MAWKKGNTHIDVSKMSQPDLVEQFAERFGSELGTLQSDSATEKWATLQDTMQRTALATFGKKTSESHDWFETKAAEFSKAINSLASGKAPGSDGIPDLINHCKTTLLLLLHKVLSQCWKEGTVTQNMRDAKIDTLYKNKGE